MTSAVSGTHSAVLLEIRDLETKLVSIIGKEQFEHLSKTRLLPNLHLVAFPLSIAVEVEEGTRFAALLVAIQNSKSPSEISDLFYKVFALKYKTSDQPKFEKATEQFLSELHKKIIKDLNEQYNIASTPMELDAIAQAEKELAELTTEDLTQVLKMMNHGLAGGIQTFVDPDKAKVFNPYIEAVGKDWRLSVNYPLLEQCFDRALHEYGKGVDDYSIALKNTRLKQMRADYLTSLQTAKIQLAASKKESKAV